MTTPATTTTRSKKPLVVGVVVVLLVVGVAGWWFLIRDDSPAAFDIEAAAEGAGDDRNGTEDEENGDDGGLEDTDDATVEGTWTIDPDAGADAGGTSAGFRVDEELANIGAATAVGRTEGVEGTLTIDGTTVSAVDIAVDLASMQTDDSRRDNKMHSALATDEFPTATFTLTEPIELGTPPADGETVSVTAMGDMTIKGVTNPVEVALDARLVDGTLVVVGSTPVVFPDYGVDKPTAAIVVSLEDRGTIEFQLFFEKA